MPLGLFEGVLGGIGLFLLGMRLLSGGIRTVADDRVRRALALFTSNRFYSLLFGMFLSLALNSAPAAVIFAIGLANGGILSTFQGLNVLGGALVGASLSLHVTGMPYALVAGPLIFVGVVLKYFSHSRRLANAGELLLGAGLLFLGLTMLEESFSPFDRHPFYQVSGGFFTSELFTLAFGAALSLFVQSSLPVTNLIASLIDGGQLSAGAGGSMVLGSLVGVGAIGLLASIGGTSVSRRMAWTFCAIIVAVVAPLAFMSVPLLQYFENHAAVSAVHDLAAYPYLFPLAYLFSLAALLAAGAVVVLSSFVSRRQGGLEQRYGEVPQPCAGYLDERILNTPPLAMEQARKEIVRMMSVALFMYADVREILSEYDARRAATIRQHEEVLDSLNHEITAFLAKLAGSSINPQISYEIPGLLQTVIDLEHMGDSCEEILDCIVSRKEAGVVFSDAAMADLKALADGVSANLVFLDEVIRSGQWPDKETVTRMKAGMRQVTERIKQAHFDRICEAVCPPRAAKLFNEMTDAFSRIAELTWNILSRPARRSDD